MSIATLYRAASQYYQKKPDDVASEAWEETLAGIPESEIKAQIARHQADVRTDDFGRTRGAWMPFASDLLAGILDARRMTAIGNKLHPCGKCEEGWVRVFRGKTIGNSEGEKQDVDPKKGAVNPCQCRSEWIAANRKSA